MSRPGIGFALVAALVLGGCGNDVRLPTDPGPTTSPPAPSRTIAELLEAPDSLVVADVVYRSHADVYRDFMIGQDDNRARAAVRVTSAEADTIPAALIPKYVWVIHGTETWGAELEYRYSLAKYPPQPAQALSGGNGGPEWTVGDTIQIITGIIDSSGVRLLRCPDSVVQGTS